MSEKNKNILMAVIFTVSIILVIFGQRKIGYLYLFIQFLGLAGILYFISLYNERYK